MNPREQITVDAVKDLIQAMDDHEIAESALSKAVAHARDKGLSWVTIRNVMQTNRPNRIRLEWDRPPTPRIRRAVSPAIAPG